MAPCFCDKVRGGLYHLVTPSPCHLVIFKSMLVTLIIFLATFVFSSVGFGLALVAMPLLVNVIGLRVASPLVSLIGITTGFVIFFHYRATFKLRAVALLSVASLIAVPIGVQFVGRVDPKIGTTLLGILLIFYSVYSLLKLRLPRLEWPGWAIGFGFAAGLLGGAYNTGGPPVIIYANCRRWLPGEFKSNLQAFFLVNSVVAVISHLLSGHYTLVVAQNYLYAIPGILLGLFAGFKLEPHVSPVLFRKAVLLILVLLGIQLILS